MMQREASLPLVTNGRRWLSMTVMLVFGILLAACAPIRPEGSIATAANATPPAPVSDLIDSFVWQTDGLYGYRMLRPAGWEVIDLGASRGYFPPAASPQASPLLLTAVNLAALAEIDANSGAEVLPFVLFQQDPNLIPWMAALEQQWQAAGLSYTWVETLSDAQLYAFVFPESHFIELAAYLIKDNQPIIVQLDSKEATTVDKLRANGIYANFVTLVESITPIAYNPNQHEPAFIETESYPPPASAAEIGPMVYVDETLYADPAIALLGYTRQSSTQAASSPTAPVAHPIPPDLCHPLYEVNASYDYDCGEEIERYQFQQGTPTVTRDNGQLTLTLPTGDLELFTDQEGEGGGGWALYNYVNYLPELDAYLLSVHYYEGSDFLLVPATHGEKVVLPSPPVIAPDGKHFFTVFNLFENALRLFIWDIAEGQIVPRQTLRFEPINRFLGSIRLAHWVDSTHLEVGITQPGTTTEELIAVTLAPTLTVTLNGKAVARPAVDGWEVTRENAHVRQVDTVAIGKAVYADRDYVFTTVPALLDDQPYFLFENSRMNATEETYVTFHLYQPATLYVAIDEQACDLPGWMQEWAPVDGAITTNDISLKLYAKPFGAGDIVLGGNAVSPAACIRSHYLLFVVKDE